MVNTTNQIPTKRKKKFTGGNASKRHRDRVNIEFNNLAKLLPFPENVIAKLDKSSILRLAVSYIRAKSFFKDALPVNGDEQTVEKSKFPSNDDLYKGILEETCITEFFLQALDGFLIVITEDLKVLYVSESVREYLGYCQAGIIHESFLQFIHWGDEDSIKVALQFDQHQEDDSTPDVIEKEKRNTRLATEEFKRKKSEIDGKVTESTISSRIQSRRFICRMKCAFSCSSRFYTAFQAFQFSGHVRRSTIQEGKEQRTLNTLIAFGCPLNNTKIDPRDILTDSYDETRSSFEDSDHSSASMKMIGLHIEPRLRPHIAPIPIAHSEPDGKMNSQNPNHYSFGRRFGMIPHPDAHFNGSYGNSPRLYPSYHQLAHEYYRDGLRFSNGWNGRSSSLSNSPISDASSPRGIKRSASADASLESRDIISGKKLTRFDTPAYVQSQNGFKGLPLDDIHSSARILMQLKSTQRRLSENGHIPNENESDSSSSDDRSELYRNDDSYDSLCKDQVFVDQPFPSALAAKFHPSNGYAVDVSRLGTRNHYTTSEASYERSREEQSVKRHNDKYNESYIHERIMHRRLSPNRVHDERLVSVGARSSPERISKSQIFQSRYSPNSRIGSTPSKQLSPKKEANKGFHISTILGLKDDTPELPGQQPNTETDRYTNDSERGQRELIGGNFDKSKEMMGRLADNRAKMRYIVEVPSGKGGICDGAENNTITLNAEVSNMDDIKTSFAHLLQGFTATIARSIDRSIDTIFKP